MACCCHFHVYGVCMAFGHKHYVPILKGKRAEFPALGSVKSKDNFTPLMGGNSLSRRGYRTSPNGKPMA